MIVDQSLDPNLDIVIDCADPPALAVFWAAALAYRAVGFHEPHLLLLPTRRAFPPVILQRVREGDEFCVCPGAPLDL
jgi:hypothetical protein